MKSIFENNFISLKYERLIQQNGKRILNQSGVPVDVEIQKLMSSGKYGKNDYYSVFDNLMCSQKFQECGYFNIEEILNPDYRLKWMAVVGYKNEPVKQQKFTRRDAAERWLAKETLYFVRIILSRSCA